MGLETQVLKTIRQFTGRRPAYEPVDMTVLTLAHGTDESEMRAVLDTLIAEGKVRELDPAEWDVPRWEAT